MLTEEENLLLFLQTQTLHISEAQPLLLIPLLFLTVHKSCILCLRASILTWDDNPCLLLSFLFLYFFVFPGEQESVLWHIAAPPIVCRPLTYWADKYLKAIQEWCQLQSSIMRLLTRLEYVTACAKAVGGMPQLKNHLRPGQKAEALVKPSSLSSFRKCLTPSCSSPGRRSCKDPAGHFQNLYFWFKLHFILHLGCMSNIS